MTFNSVGLIKLKLSLTLLLFFVTEVLAVILSDVMFFLQENNQKYTFFSQDNKVSSDDMAFLYYKSRIVPTQDVSEVIEKVE